MVIGRVRLLENDFYLKVEGSNFYVESLEKKKAQGML